MKTNINTKYHDYTQTQRLDMIRNGNTDVYNAEKDNNAHLKSLRQSLGLSTRDIDEWDKTVDMAAKKSSSAGGASSNEAVLPKFQSTRVGSISGAYNNTMQALAKENKQKQKEAKEQAEKDVECLIEYLVNNGYSSDGKTAREGEEEIRLNLKNMLEKLQSDYMEAASAAKEKYISMLDKSRKA